MPALGGGRMISGKAAGLHSQCRYPFLMHQLSTPRSFPQSRRSSHDSKRIVFVRLIFLSILPYTIPFLSCMVYHLIQTACR